MEHFLVLARYQNLSLLFIYKLMSGMLFMGVYVYSVKTITASAQKQIRSAELIKGILFNTIVDK